MVWERRRLLRSIAAATTVGTGAHVGTSTRRTVADRGQDSWEWIGGTNAAFRGGLRTDDGYLLVGETLRDEWPSEAWAVKATAEGTTEWDEVYRSPHHQEWRAREADPDDFGGPHYEDCFETAVPDGRGGYVLAGWIYTDSPADRFGWAVNVDASGAVRWNRPVELGDENYLFHPLYDAARIGDRTLAVGAASSFTGLQGGEGLLLEFADDGSVAWWTTFATVEKGADDPRRDVFHSIRPHGDGYLLAGRAQPETERTNGWAVRVAADGAVEWRREYWHDPTSHNGFADAVPHGDGALLVGTAGDDGWAVEVDAAGDVLESRTYPDATITCARPGEPPVLAGRRYGHRWATQYDGDVLFDVDPDDGADDVRSEFYSIVPDDGGSLFVGERQGPDAESPSGWAAYEPGSTDSDDGDDGDEALERHLLVCSFSPDHTGSYRFEVSGSVERTDHAGDAPYDHGSVTVGDGEDETEGGTVTGGVAGGGDAYRITGELESFRVERGGDHVFAYLDGQPLDDWTSANRPTHLVLGGGDTDGHVVGYSFEATGSVQQTGRAHEVPVDADLVTNDPDDVVDGAAVDGAVAGAFDAFYYSGELSRFRIDDCDHSSVEAWTDGSEVDPCGLGN